MPKEGKEKESERQGTSKDEICRKEDKYGREGGRLNIQFIKWINMPKNMYIVQPKTQNKITDRRLYYTTSFEIFFQRKLETLF